MIQKMVDGQETGRAEEEHVFDELAGNDIDGMLEIYLRMNADMEKDYCFNVGVNKRFGELYPIFKTLPVALNPSIFYRDQPVGFYVSHHPGYLTRTGGLLFSYDADKDKYLVPVHDEDTISDKCWPGQLILPKWELHYGRFFSVVSFLLLWLYTDLPDFISPTPGICLTNQISKFFSWAVLKYLHNERLAADIVSEVYAEYSIWSQLGFFLLHIVKVLIVFAIFQLGIFNPYKFQINVFKKKPKFEVTKEALMEIGWTSARKANIDEFKEFYHKYAIDKAGGLVQASRAGLFKELSKSGIELSDGEGFATKLPVDEEDKGVNSITLAKMRKMDEFKLNYDYIATVGEDFEKRLASSTNPGEDIKNFRRYGPLDLPEELKDIVMDRINLSGAGQLLSKELQAEKQAENN